MRASARSLSGAARARHVPKRKQRALAKQKGVMVDELVWENAECFHAFFKSVLKIC